MPTALIVIDVQEEYFSGRLPIEYPPRADSLGRIAASMDRASAAGIPVVVVRHIGEPGGATFQAGTATGALRPEIADRPHDLSIDKRLPGSFTGTELGDWLAANDIDRLTIVGYMTNVCCDTTARQALHRGLGATILHDAVGVPDMPGVDGRSIAAEPLHHAALAPLGLIGVELITADAWAAALG